MIRRHSSVYSVVERGVLSQWNVGTKYRGRRKTIARKKRRNRLEASLWVGSGHAFTGSGWVGSQNLDPRATLVRRGRRVGGSRDVLGVHAFSSLSSCSGCACVILWRKARRNCTRIYSQNCLPWHKKSSEITGKDIWPMPLVVFQSTTLYKLITSVTGRWYTSCYNCCSLYPT